MKISLKSLIGNRIPKSLPRRRHRFPKSDLVAVTIEKLEDRTLLTGNVVAAFHGDNLFLTGDNADNSIGIALVNNQMVLSGFEGTTINGINEFLAAGRPALRDDLRIFLRGGDDTILIGPGMDFQNVIMVTGLGNDTVDISGSVILDNLTIITGPSDDGVRLNDVTVGDNQVILTGQGDDTISIEQGTVGKRQHVLTFGGDDVVSITGTNVNRHSILVTGTGDDSLVIDNSKLGKPLIGLTGPGDDFLSIDPASKSNSKHVLGFGDVSTDPVDIDNRFNNPQTGVNPRLARLRDNIGSLINPVAGDDDFLFTGTDTLSVDATNGLLENDSATFPGDQLSVSLAQGPANGAVDLNADGSFVYTPNPTFSGVETFTYLLSGSLGGADVGNVSITVEELNLDLDLSSNDTIQSNGTLLTDQMTFNIAGTTVANAMVNIDKNGDGVFDDGTVMADAMGLFSIDVDLIHDNQNRGENTIQVRSTSPVTQRQKTEEVNVHFAVGTVMRFNSSLGPLDVELLDKDEPRTVANFLNYMERLKDSIIHRSVSNFIIQGGGFNFDSTTMPSVKRLVTDPPIDNEFQPQNSNVRGTLSMAQLGGDINSGTSQWFFNVVDNLFLDNVPHTVFGTVIGTGMDIVDAINAADTFNLNGVFPETALTDVPLVNYTPFTKALTGTVSISTSGNTLTGLGTSFQSELTGSLSGAPGSAIKIDGQEFTVSAVISDTEARLSSTPNAVASTAQAFVNAEPLEANFVLFSDISKILEQMP